MRHEAKPWGLSWPCLGRLVRYLPPHTWPCTSETEAHAARGDLGCDREGVGRGWPNLSLSVHTVTEWVGPLWRTRAVVLAQCAFSVGEMALAGLAYGIRNWRHFQMAGTAPVLLLFFYFW